MILFLGFSMYSIMSTENSKSFTSFPIWIFKIYFSSLIAVARTYRTMLNNHGESRNPCLIPDLRGNAFSFLSLRTMLAVGLCEELTHLKRPWCWERLKVGEGDDQKWDGWMASLIQWTWIWVSSRSWWWTGKPGMQQSMGLQRVRHDWVTELNWRLIIYGLHYVEVGSFYAHFLKSFNHKWVLNFVKGFFCIYWDYHMFLTFNLLIWRNHIDWFACIEISLHP